MLPANITGALNRLLAIHCRSFPQYLAYARPYATGESGEKLQVIEQVVDDQRLLSGRIADVLKEADQTPNTGRFPMEFTDTHDLSIDYLLQEAVRYQREDIADVEACVAALANFPRGLMLAEEALGMAKGHLQCLEEAAAGKAKAGAVAASNL